MSRLHRTAPRPLAADTVRCGIPRRVLASRIGSAALGFLALGIAGAPAHAIELQAGSAPTADPALDLVREDYVGQLLTLEPEIRSVVSLSTQATSRFAECDDATATPGADEDPYADTRCRLEGFVLMRDALEASRVLHDKRIDLHARMADRYARELDDKRRSSENQRLVLEERLEAYRASIPELDRIAARLETDEELDPERRVELALFLNGLGREHDILIDKQQLVAVLDRAVERTGMIHRAAVEQHGNVVVAADEVGNWIQRIDVKLELLRSIEREGLDARQFSDTLTATGSIGSRGDAVVEAIARMSGDYSMPRNASGPAWQGLDLDAGRLSNDVLVGKIRALTAIP